MNKNVSKKPALVTDLEIVYWPPSQEALGSAVFSEVMKDSDLDEASVEKYKYFVDKFWEQYGDEAWMGPRKKVYIREDNRGSRSESLKDIYEVPGESAHVNYHQ